jgi:hypothetical protein
MLSSWKLLLSIHFQSVNSRGYQPFLCAGQRGKTCHGGYYNVNVQKKMLIQ